VETKGDRLERRRGIINGIKQILDLITAPPIQGRVVIPFYRLPPIAPTLHHPIMAWSAIIIPFGGVVSNAVFKVDAMGGTVAVNPIYRHR
jgi:hypothetical protein